AGKSLGRRIQGLSTVQGIIDPRRDLDKVGIEEEIALRLGGDAKGSKALIGGDSADDPYGARFISDLSRRDILLLHMDIEKIFDCQKEPYLESVQDIDGIAHLLILRNQLFLNNGMIAVETIFVTESIHLILVGIVMNVTIRADKRMGRIKE